MGFFEATGITDDATREIARLMKSEGNAYEQDSKLIVRFYMGSILNQEKTLKEGRPIYDDLEKIRILKIGEKDYIDKGSNAEYVRRFSKQYEAFKRNEEVKQSGTPLSMWPVLRESQARELAAINIHTVEQLASLPDTVAQKFMGGFAIRQAAQEYVTHATTQAPLAALQAQIDEKDAKLAHMEAQMQQMSTVLAGMQAAGKLPTLAVPQAPVAPSPAGAVPYSGPSFPVAPDAPPPATPAEGQAAAERLQEILSGKATPAAVPKRKARPPKAASAQ